MASWIGAALLLAGEPVRAQALQEGLTDHFGRWLDQNGYDRVRFERADIPGGSYGGRRKSGDPVVREPVVFVHGNSDSALGTGASGLTGWRSTIEYLLGQGYTHSELYATSWGPADPWRASEQSHTFGRLEQVRSFLEAVLAYTGAAKVDVISHSMGVTLARKAIKGGPCYDTRAGTWCDLGPPLTQRIDTFVGIAGANLGLTSCYLDARSPTCSSVDGFFPGVAAGWLGVYGRSAFLDELNRHPGFEGSYVYSIWSSADQLIGYGCLVWGRYTTRIPGQIGEVRFYGWPYGHTGCKDRTAAEQLQLIRDHRVP